MRSGNIDQRLQEFFRGPISACRLCTYLAASRPAHGRVSNILVHAYDDVDLNVVRDIVENRLDDLLRFVEAIHRRM